MTDVFVSLTGGSVVIDNSQFDHIATLKALVWVTSNADVQLLNSKFEKIVSLIQTSLIFSIQNPDGLVELDNCTVQNTLSEQSLFQITYSSMHVKNSRIITNYAKLSAHVLSSIQSDIYVYNTTIDNSLNDMGIPYYIIMSQDGLGSLNYQSQIFFENVTISGMRALQYAVIQSSSDSVIVINGSSLITNCTQSTSSFSTLQASKFEIRNTTFLNTDVISITNQLRNAFIIENVKFEWNIKEYGEPPQRLKLTDCKGLIRNTTFQNDI